MASTLTPRPPAATNLHRRNLSHHTLTDTPTPQSQSSSNSISTLMQSLNNLNNKQQQPSSSYSHSRPLKPLSQHSTTTSRLHNIGNSINHLDPIQPDDTELQRKEHEQSFERMMQELQDARISSSEEGESDSSRGVRENKHQFRDEERESDARTSDDYSDSPGDDEDEEEDGSIRIGLSGVRYNHRNNNNTQPLTQPLDQLAQLAQDDQVDHDSDDLTYLTIPRSQIDQLSPVKQQKSPLRTTSAKPLAPSSNSNLFTSSPARRPTQPSSTAAVKENVPLPSSHNVARSAAPPSTFLSSFSPRPQPLRTSPFTSAPLSQPQTNYRSSPLNPLQNSPVLAQKSTSSQQSQSQSRSVLSPPLAQRKGGRPVTIEEVSDQGTPPRSREFRRRDESATGGVRLPDMTFLTEALRSPVVEKRAASTVRRSESKGSGSTGSGSKEAPLITGALSTLTSKLSALESENLSSSRRVQELERQLAQFQHQARLNSHTRSRQEEELTSRVQDELRAERARRESLESLVSQLRRPQPAAAPARPSLEACNTALELKEEVQDLKFGLEGLGYEVEGVRGVVEGLLRDKEGDLGEKRWRREEEERRRELQRTEREKEAVPSTPVSESESGESRRSFVSAQEIEKLRQEQAEEIKRRSPAANPKRRTTRTHTHAHVKRPISVASSYDSAQDSSYTPSIRSSSSLSHSSVSTTLTAPSESSQSQGEVEEPDFERATRIFEDVERAERRERRERLRDAKEREKSEELCKRCKGKKRGEEKEKEVREKVERENRRKVAAQVEKEKEKEQEKARREKEQIEKKRKMQERETHCRTLQGVLEKLEMDFAGQKKIYLELTVEYQSMGSKSSTKKRMALAQHLKMSIDVLEEKAKDVKQYADALEDLYATALSSSSSNLKHQH
ncbi:hypothetical protein JCM5353_007673 [Sporobolomyces roseus]